MRTTKIAIKHLFGIKECELGGKNYEISGETATGKSSILDALRLAITNKSNREFIIHTGSREGEIIIETDTGVNITRKYRTDKADYKSIKEDGKDVQSPEAFLRNLFTPLQLDPVKFLTYDIKEQNRIILDLIDFKWDLDWIKKEFGELPPDVCFEQNILRVLNDIQAEDGYYFMTRQDINRRIRNIKAFVDEIGAQLPSGYNAEKWRNVALAPLYTEIETKRARNRRIEKAKDFISSCDAKVRGFQAEKEIKMNALNSETSARRNSIDKEIVSLETRIRELKTELSTIEESKQDKIAIINSEHEANIAEFEAKRKELEPLAEKKMQSVDDLIEEAQMSEKMKEYVREYDRMVGHQNEIVKLSDESDAFTAKIDHARELPGKILQNCDIPIAGLTIVECEPRINGLPVSNLSDGEKLCLCVDITKKGCGTLNIILIDGVEKLSANHRTMLYEKCRESGVQFIATLTDDSPDLTITEL